MANNCPICRLVTASTLAPDAAATCPRCGRSLREDAAENAKTSTASIVGRSAECEDTASGPLPPGISVDTHQPGESLLGRYTLVRELGRGTFGSVWLAQDEQLDRKVAVKIPRRLDMDASESDLFAHEAKIAAQLSHPGIVAVYDVQKLDSGEWFVVMEYIDGRTLQETLRDTRCTPDQAASWCTKSPTRCTPPIARAWSTATSNPEMSCSIGSAARTLPTLV